MPTAIETNRKYADFDAVLMEGVGHYPQLERPEEFNRELLRVLEELSASG
jgi:pimeloyl-ACP methyl ester carboxylesterase